MRNGLSSAVVLLAMASLSFSFLGGCASKATVTAKSPAPHISVAMDEETHRALLGLGDDDANAPVGTTTLTGADLYIAPAPAAPAPVAAAAPLASLPDGRGSLGLLRTWGTAPPSDIDGIPTTRE